MGNVFLYRTRAAGLAKNGFFLPKRHWLRILVLTWSLSLLFGASLPAQTVRLVRLTNPGPLYMGDAVSLGADFEFEGIPLLASGSFVLREVFEGGLVRERTQSLSRTLPTPRITSYRVPQLLSCEPPGCPDSIPTVAAGYERILRLEMFGFIRNDDGSVLARSETRTINIIPPPEIVSISPSSQPLQSQTRVRIRTTGFNFTRTGGLGRGITLILAHSRDQSRVWRQGFNQDVSNSTLACANPGPQLTFSLCNPQVLGDNELEFDLTTFARAESAGVSDFEHIGPHDLIIISREPREDQPQRTDPRARWAVRLNAYTFADPPTNDVILWKGLTLQIRSQSSTRRVLNPELVNFFPTGGGVEITVEATMDYRLARKLDARLWLRARDDARVFLEDLSTPLQVSRAVRNTGGGLVELTYSKNFRLPAGERYIYFTLLLDAGVASDPEPRNVIYEARPAVVFFGQSAPPEADVDVEPRYIELTQAIQDDNNNVRMVANKPTLARVYIGVGSPPPPGDISVEAILHGFPAGSNTPLPGSPLQPMAGFNRAPARARAHDRSRAAESVNFKWPPEWTREGFLTLVAEVDPAGKIPNERRENNYGGQETFRFFPRPKLSIGYVSLCVQTPGREVRCPAGFVANSEGFIQRAYPVAPADVFYFPLPIPQTTLVADLNDYDERQKLLKRMRKLYDMADFVTGGALNQIAVWVHPFVPIGDRVGGFSDPKWYSAEAQGRISILREPTSTLSRSTLLAHEIGHNFGLRHPNLGNGGCGSADDDSDWRFPDETIQEVGYNRGGIPFVLKPQDYKDVMSYCSPNDLWISEFHYDKLFDSNFSPQGNAVSEPENDVISEPAQALGVLQGVAAGYWVISGSVREGGAAGQLDPAYRLTSRTPPDPTRQTGEYCVQLSSPSGAAAAHCLNLEFVEPDTSAPIDTAHFSLRVPDPGGIVKIALLHNGRELAALNGGGASPTVNITSPASGTTWNGGEQMVLWNAADRDGDPLTYAVLYSSDGGQTWYPLEIDTSQRQSAVNTAHIQGGNVMFRVLATDGLNTAEAVVDSITVVQRREIAAEPLSLDLGGAAPGLGVEGRFTLTNRGSGPLTISAITSNNPAFEIVSPSTPATVMSGASRELGVRFTAANITSQTATITVTSNADARPNLTLSVRAAGVSTATPVIAVASDPIHFGALFVGASQTTAVQVFNPGAADLRIEAAVTGEGFWLDALTGRVTIPAGGEATMTARFAPTSVKEFAGTLAITSDDPNRPKVELLLSGSGLPPAASGPQPRINDGGIVDAAAFLPTLAPGGIGSIFGVDLADATVSATAVPLPTELGGVRLLINGVAAPLFFVSAFQINFQTPFEAGAGDLTAMVVRNGVPGSPQVAVSRSYAPAIFMNPNAGEPIVQRPDGSLVTAGSPARAGEALIFYVTGIGALDNVPATGSAATGSPLSTALERPSMTVGGAAANVLFGGLAPFFVGLGQVNAILPDPLPVGGATLPVVIRFGESGSQMVNLPVSR